MLIFNRNLYLLILAGVRVRMINNNRYMLVKCLQLFLFPFLKMLNKIKIYLFIAVYKIRVVSIFIFIQEIKLIIFLMVITFFRIYLKKLIRLFKQI